MSDPVPRSNQSYAPLTHLGLHALFEGGKSALAPRRLGMARLGRRLRRGCQGMGARLPSCAAVGKSNRDGAMGSVHTVASPSLTSTTSASPEPGPASPNENLQCEPRLHPPRRFVVKFHEVRGSYANDAE